MASDSNETISHDELYADALEALNDAKQLESLSTENQLICECHCVSSLEILEFARECEAPNAFKVLQETLNVGTGCGKCSELAKKFLGEILEN